MGRGRQFTRRAAARSRRTCRRYSGHGDRASPGTGSAGAARRLSGTCVHGNATIAGRLRARIRRRPRLCPGASKSGEASRRARRPDGGADPRPPRRKGGGERSRVAARANDDRRRATVLLSRDDLSLADAERLVHSFDAWSRCYGAYLPIGSCILALAARASTAEPAWRRVAEGVIAVCEQSAEDTRAALADCDPCFAWDVPAMRFWIALCAEIRRRWDLESG